MTSIKCNTCGKSVRSQKEFVISGRPVSLLECGHAYAHKFLGDAKEDLTKITSIDGKRPFPYQQVGVQFIENANGRCLIGDEMRLGKTVQALTALRLHPEMLPAVIVVKSSTKIQWQREVMRWVHEDCIAQIVEDKHFIKGFPIYILSYDILPTLSGVRARKALIRKTLESKKEVTDYLEPTEAKEDNDLVKKIKELKIKTLILDEVQQISNVEAQRTQEVRELSKHVEYVIALSGTAIKNHAGEYFPVLNIIRPELFPTEAGYIRDHCAYYSTPSGTMKIGGIRDIDEFQAKTKGFILRRTRDEVMPDMPKVFRTFSFHELGKEVEGAYKRLLKEFQDSSEGLTGLAAASNDLAYMSRMRHLTGISKVNPCVEKVMDFLESSATGKITVFVHHQDVGQMLMLKLGQQMKDQGYLPPVEIISGLAGDVRQNVVDDFQNNPLRRVCVASTLSAGEGLTLSKCSSFIMLERQWNPANEEQAESRFPHVENVGSINGDYLVATGTIDEFFATLVEKKREFVGQTLNGIAVRWDESSLIQELKEILRNKR